MRSGTPGHDSPHADRSLAPDARAHLEGLGTRFDGDTHEIEGMVKLATFYDPDGNAWSLQQLPDWSSGAGGSGDSG